MSDTSTNPSSDSSSQDEVEEGVANGQDDDDSVKDPLADAVDQMVDQIRNGASLDAPRFDGQQTHLWDDVGEAAQSLFEVWGTQAAGGEASWLPRELGPFRLLRQIGQGGMGTVYEAEQLRPQRRVALKVLNFSRLGDAKSRARFQMETQAAAELEHSHIVPVYSVSCDSEPWYFTMRLMPGGNLGARLDQFRDQPRRAAELLIPICQAVNHAHQRGILHRDLTPSNILLDEHGQPHVGDFGLAKSLMGPTVLTGSRDLVGTPSFMAPEQAQSPNQATTATDVYGLGAILFALLAGQPPFAGQNMVEVIQQIRSGPPRLHDHNRSVPRDLKRICEMAMHPEPTRRYASPQALADDLSRYLAGVPVMACRLSGRERLWMWTRRHPIRALLATAIMFGITLSLVAILAHQMILSGLNRDLTRLVEDVSDAHRQTRQEREYGRQVQIKTSRLLYAADMQLIVNALAAGDSRSAQSLLRQLQPMPGFPDERGLEWYWLWNVVSPPGTTELVSQAPLYAIGTSPDDRWLAVAGESARIYLLDRQAPEAPPVVWDSQQKEVNGLAFSPDGTMLATAGEDGSICVWQLATKQLMHRAEATTKTVFQVAFTSDGQTLISCDADGAIVLWDTPTWTERRRLLDHTGSVSAIALAPDDQHLASVGLDGRLVVWNLADGQPVWSFTSDLMRFSCVAYSPDGQHLAAGTVMGRVRLFRSQDGALLPHHDRKDGISAVVFSNRAPRLYVADRGGAVGWLSFDPSAVSADPVTSPSREAGRFWRGHTSRVFALLEDGDGQLVSIDGNGHLHWSDPDASIAEPAFVQATAVPNACLLDVCQALVYIDSQGVWMRALESDEPRQLLAAGSDWQDLAVTDGRPSTIAAWSPTRVAIWSLNEQRVAERTAEFAVNGMPPARIALSPDNRLLAVSSQEPERKRLDLYDIPSARPVASWPIDNWTAGPRFSSDGRWLACDDTNLVLVFDVATRQLTHRLSGHLSTVTDMAFAPRDNRLATVSHDRTMKIWQLPSGRLLTDAPGYSDPLRVICWSSDGLSLISGDWQGNLTAWQGTTGKPLCRLHRIPYVPDLIRLSSDMRWLVITDTQPSLKLFRLQIDRDQTTSMSQSPQH